MKLLFVLDNYIKYYSIDDVVRELYRRGHEIVIIVGQEEKMNLPDDALQKAREDLPGLKMESLFTRKFLRNFTKYIRELLNYAYILNNEEMRKWDVAKWNRFFPPYIWRMVTSNFGIRKLKDRSFQKWLRSIEQKIPVDSSVQKQIKKHDPDLLIALPLINADSRENEYVQAAHALGLPSIYSMFSWDNIASKGTFQSRPDYHIVWNTSLAEELVRMHGIPFDRIFVTGAPRFDRLIENGKSYILPRDEFCKIAGINKDKKYVLYVGSTFLVNKEFRKSMNEDALVLEIADAFEENPQTSEIDIVVRPHSSNPGIVGRLQKHQRRNIFIYPFLGELPDTEEKRRNFYNSIYHSVAVIGVNTTAFVEAAAFNKPCITYVTQEFGETQHLPHFHHLADADFLETAHEAMEVAKIVGEINDGKDARSMRRVEFIKKFLRPLESGKSAVDAYADLLENIFLEVKRKA